MLKSKAVKLISSKLACKKFMDSHKLLPQAFSRQRKLTFFNVMILIIRKSVKSLQVSLNEYITQISKGFTVTASAFTQARHKLSYTAFVELNNDIIELYYKEKSNTIKTFKGYRLLGFDGCKITVPDNSETENEFGARANGNIFQKDAGRCIRATYEAAYDLLNNIAFAGILDKGNVYEAHLARELIDSMSSTDLGVFDRAYGSYDLMSEMIMKKKHFLIRCQRKTFTEIQEIFKSKETNLSKFITLRPSHNNLKKVVKSILPNKIDVRAIKITLPNGEPEVLITSLLDDQEFSIKDFAELYKLRWKVETFFGKLKGRLNIDHFSGKSVNAIKQDIWSTIFLSNLETIITEDIDKKLENSSKQKGIKSKRIKKSISFNAIKNHAMELFCSESDHLAILNKLEQLFLINTDYNRPGRTAPRNKVSGFKKWRYHKCIKKQVF